MDEEPLFEAQDIGDAVILSPVRNLGEFEISGTDADQLSVFEQLVKLSNGRHVVLDLSRTDYFGSSTIGLFNRLVIHVRKKNRRIAFCNLSEHEKEVISITHIDRLWDVKDSREAALQFVTASDS